MFNKTKTDQEKKTRPDSKGSNFITETKLELAANFASFVENADYYQEVSAYTTDLERETWKIIEPRLKMSYANGIKVARGKR